MREPLEGFEPRDQHFPAPNLSIYSVAGAIKREADHRPFKAMLGHATGNVRVMMLHGYQWQPPLVRPFFCPLGRQVARMQVMDHGLRLNLKGPHQVVQRLAEEFKPSEVFQIT